MTEVVAERMDILRCPYDISPLSWTQTGAAQYLGEPPEGKLECATCGRAYPVSEGVAQFVSGKLDDDRKTFEMRVRDKEAEGYDQFMRLNEEVNTSQLCFDALKPVATDTVIDLGCGTGQLTQELLPYVRRVIAMDFSLASLKVFRRNVPDVLRPKLLLIQGDICAPPVSRRAFTQAAAFRVIQQLPSKGMRNEVFNTIASLLTASGRLTLTVDHWSLPKRLYARRGICDHAQKEGMHSNNLYYYNFEPSELRDSVQRAGMQIEFMRGLEIGLPGARLLKGLAIPIKLIMSRSQLGIKLAQLLLCRARLRPGGPPAPNG